MVKCPAESERVRRRGDRHRYELLAEVLDLVSGFEILEFQARAGSRFSPRTGSNASHSNGARGTGPS